MLNRNPKKSTNVIDILKKELGNNIDLSFIKLILVIYLLLEQQQMKFLKQ
jgi:hypothetical protein